MNMAVETVGRKKLGIQGLEVSAIGLGCMSFAGIYRAEDIVPDENALKVIHRAFNRGVTFFDTSDFYGPHTNEILIGKAIKSLPREKLQIATKFANHFKDGGVAIRGDPEYVRQACEDSLKRLDVDYIDLYYQHRVDASVPIEVTMGELKKLVEEGKIKYICLSEAAPDTIRRAHAVHPITAVQLEYSLWCRDIEGEMMSLCRAVYDIDDLQGTWDWKVPYSPLGRGFFAGKASVEKLDAKDRRAALYPKFAEENLVKNKIIFERVAALAKKYGCSPGQLALAWVCNQGDDRVSVVPIPGTSKVANLDENLDALKIKLGPRELEEVAAAVPKEDVAGSRYNPAYGRLSITWEDAVTPPLESWTPQAS